MILYKLKEMECEIEQSKSQNIGLIKAISSLKKLLLQINFKAEVIPEENPKKLKQILIGLKGQSLNKEEENLLKQLYKL
jgi:hypothetical protein